MIIKDSTTLDVSFKKLGKHLSDTLSAYESSQKRLDLMSKKVGKLIDYKEKAEDLIENDELSISENNNQNS